MIQRQKFETAGVWSGSYQVSRTYNLAGGVTTQTYPSDRKVYYGYDGAGRPSSFTGELGDNVNRTYAQGINYSPLGGITNEQFGTNTLLYNKSVYNNRGQLSEIRVSTNASAQPDWNRGAILNQYSDQCNGPSCNGTDNNGNLKGQEVWIPHSDQASPYTNWVQQYDYDSLNRLQRVKELNSSTMWQQEYFYDRWGNRSLHQTNTWGAGINKKDFTVNPANNRLGVPGGQSGSMTYDDAGNLTNDTYSGAGARTYDAENRMTKAWGGNNQWQEYTYNADGQRVRRKVDGVETRQVYGMDGELLAEYAGNATPTSPQKEYGYRNGQLLITAASAQGCGVGYTGAKTWTATNASLGHATGHQEGNNWAVYVGSDASNVMVYGPYDNSFGQGHHTAQFWLMVDNNSGTDVVATIDVVTGYGSNNLGQRQIRRNEFVGVNQWQVFTLEFDNPCFGLVESRVWWSGTVNMKFNQVTITTTSTLAVDLEWLVADQLGTPRMIANQTGTLTGVRRHDYLPFGEELVAGVGSRTAQNGYTNDNVRQKFTLYERDFETGLDFAQARYHGYVLGRFTSPDPLAASANPIRPQSWNRYSYSYNNPLRFTDPSGMIAGDFYNLDGKNIGTDGISDGKIYIVYDKDKAKEIEKTTGSYTGTVDSKIEIPNTDVVTAVGNAVTKSNNAPFSGDLKGGKASGGFQETGASWKTTDGTTEITAAPGGPTSDPRGQKAEISMPSDVDGKVHVHPSGEIVTTSSSSSSTPGVTVIGGTVTEEKAFFVQKPSAVDVSNAVNGTNIVVGAGNKTVYFYKSSGNKSDCNCVAKMSLGNFMKIGRQR